MRLTRLAMVAVLGCAACTTLPASSVRPSRSEPSPAQLASGIAAAQADLYANHYDAADAEYARLLGAAPRSARVHAGYALLLNYRGDATDAAREAALAARLDPGDGLAAAILCRVDDWAIRLDEAVASGRRAIRLSPGEPLAHLFLSEALADGGDTTAAGTEISLAASLIAKHPSPYLIGEQQREQANLDGDLGDRAAAVTAFRAALASQPAWLYRTSELVDAELVAGDAASARQTLDGVAAAAPDDVGALETLGDNAIFIADAGAASALWARALALSPDDPRALDANGELQVAVKHDINAAVTDFERALRNNPRDAQAAAYLLALARYVSGNPTLGRDEIVAALLAGSSTGPPPRRPPMIPNPDAVTSADAGTALAAVNTARTQAGLPPVHLDARLSASATSHSFYWLFNNLAPSVAGLGIHLESRGLTGYSGVFPWTRAVAFRYPNMHVGEDIAHSGAPGSAVGDWVNSVFHRFAILRPDLSVIGYGEADCGGLLMEDMEFGFGPATSAAPVLYPGAGQTSVPATFVDNELPDPVPAGKPRTTGYPVTVTFPAADRVTMSSFSLTASSGAALAAYLLAPSAATENSASLLPAAPLTPGVTYTATIAATVDGHPFQRTWTFTVG